MQIPFSCPRIIQRNVKKQRQLSRSEMSVSLQNINFVNTNHHICEGIIRKVIFLIKALCEWIRVQQLCVALDRDYLRIGFLFYFFLPWTKFSESINQLPSLFTSICANKDVLVVLYSNISVFCSISVPCVMCNKAEGPCGHISGVF